MATEELHDDELKDAQDEEITQGETTEGTEQGASEGEADDTLKKDAELDGANTDDEREAIRARRRQERHDKKQAIRDREDSYRRELASRDAVINDMKQRLDVIDQKSHGSEVAQLDAAIKQSAEAYHYFKGQIALGVQAQDGNAVAEAQEQMIIAQRKYEDFTNTKKAWQQNSQKTPPLDPRTAENGRKFIERNPWYANDNDSEDVDIAKAIDRRLHKDGWDPVTPQYWEELEKRLQKKLPHRYKKVYSQEKEVPRDRPNTVSGSDRESAPNGSVSNFTLSSKRVQALKDAGMYNDRVLRDRMIKRYKEEDRLLGQSN